MKQNHNAYFIVEMRFAQLSYKLLAQYCAGPAPISTLIDNALVVVEEVIYLDNAISPTVRVVEVAAHIRKLRLHKLTTPMVQNICLLL